jgi:hypothetical protein
LLDRIRREIFRKLYLFFTFSLPRDGVSATGTGLGAGLVLFDPEWSRSGKWELGKLRAEIPWSEIFQKLYHFHTISLPRDGVLANNALRFSTKWAIK